MSSVTKRANTGSVDVQRKDSSMAARRTLRSRLAASRASGLASRAAMVMPICFHVVPEPAARRR